MKKHNFEEPENNPDLNLKHIPFHYFMYFSDDNMMVMRIYSRAEHQGSHFNCHLVAMYIWASYFLNFCYVSFLTHKRESFYRIVMKIKCVHHK